MPANLSPVQIRCLIGGVDYSDQVFSWGFRYKRLDAGVAGGVLPFSGDIQLGEHPGGLLINNRIDFGLFGLGAEVAFSLELAGVWYPLPPMEILRANYNLEERRSTLVVGDVLFINSEIEQNVDSRAADIQIGGARSGARVIGNLLREIGISETIREAESALTFRYPRNFGRNYVTAANQVANAERVVVYTEPSGRVVIREAWTRVVTEGAQFPLPHFGSYRFGEQLGFADQLGVNRPLSECTAVALPASIGTHYSANASYYEIFETPESTVSRSSGGSEVTTIANDFTAATVRQVTTVREANEDIYSGLAANVAPLSGTSESRSTDELQEFDRNEPGRFLRSKTTETARVAVVAQSLLGWYAQDEDEQHTNEAGEVISQPYTGALWSSQITAKETEVVVSYESERPTYMDYRSETVKMPAIAIYDGLTGGIPWDLILEHSPVGLNVPQTVSESEIRWSEDGKGNWVPREYQSTIKALADTGARSAIINGLQKAGDDEDTAKIRYWLQQALKRTKPIKSSPPGSPDNAPPAFTPKPRQYRGESTNTLVETFVGYTGNSTRDVPRSVSIPFVSDEVGTAEGQSKARANAQNFIQKVARRDRMEAKSWQLQIPLYPEILTGLSPYSSMDIYHSELGATYRVITAGLSIAGDANEAVFHCVAPTLARMENGIAIQPLN